MSIDRLMSSEVSLWFFGGTAFSLRLLVLADHSGHCTLGDPHLDAVGDLDPQLVALDRGDGPKEAARSHDLLPDPDLSEQLPSRLLTAPLRPDDQEPHQGEQNEDENVGGHRASSGGGRCEPAEGFSLVCRQPAFLDRRTRVRGQVKQES